MSYEIDPAKRLFETAKANLTATQEEAARALADAVCEAARQAGGEADFRHQVYAVRMGHCVARMAVLKSVLHAAPGATTLEWTPVPGLVFDKVTKTFRSTVEDRSVYPTPGAARYREPVSVVTEHLLTLMLD